MEIKTAADLLLTGHNKTDQILKIANKQARIAEKQFWISLFITIASLIIGILPLMVNQNKYLDESIEDIKKLQSKTRNEQAIYLDSIQKKVKTLEKQIEVLNKKISL